MLRALCLTLILPNLAGAQGFEGVYRPEGAAGAGWDCSRIGQDRGAYQILGNQVHGLEYRCELDRAVPEAGSTPARFEADCFVEGTPFATSFVIVPWQDGPARGVRIIEDGQVDTWVACDASSGGAAWHHVHGPTTAQSTGGEVDVSCDAVNRFVGITFDRSPQLRATNGLTLRFDDGTMARFHDSRVERLDSGTGARFQILFGSSTQERRLMGRLLGLLAAHDTLEASVWQTRMTVPLRGSAAALRACRALLDG